MSEVSTSSFSKRYFSFFDSCHAYALLAFGQDQNADQPMKIFQLIPWISWKWKVLSAWRFVLLIQVKLWIDTEVSPDQCQEKSNFKSYSYVTQYSQLMLRSSTHLVIWDVKVFYKNTEKNSVHFQRNSWTQFCQMSSS